MDDTERLNERLREGAAASPEAYAAALCQALSIWSQREAAARALVRIGAPAVEPLRQALLSKQAGVRTCAIRALGRIGAARAVPALCDALRDLDPGVRAAAMAALSQIGDPAAAAPHLLALLRSPGAETARAAAAALGKIGDRRALLPLWEALLDAPSERDSYLGAALVEMAWRQPGPELREVLRRLSRELEALDGKSRKALEELRWHLVRAAAPLGDMPIPAAAPAPSRESLPLPAAPAAPAAEHLPLPASAPPAAAAHGTGHSPKPHPGASSPAHRKTAGVPASAGVSGLSPEAPPGPTQTGICPPASSSPLVAEAGPASRAPRAADPASEEILNRFHSVEAEAIRTWAGLQPVRVENEIVFRRGMIRTSVEAAVSRASAVLALLGWLAAVGFFGFQPRLWSFWFAVAALLLWAVAGKKLGLRRLYFKVDSITREMVIYPRLMERGIPKRKRLPLDQIVCFLGHSKRNAGDGMGDRLSAVLANGSLEALTDNLGTDGHVAVNLRILAVTCARPAYLLNASAKTDDLLAPRPGGRFAIQDFAKLWERANRLYTPDESAKASDHAKNL